MSTADSRRFSVTKLTILSKTNNMPTLPPAKVGYKTEISFPNKINSTSFLMKNYEDCLAISKFTQSLILHLPVEPAIERFSVLFHFDLRIFVVILLLERKRATNR